MWTTPALIVIYVGILRPNFSSGMMAVIPMFIASHRHRKKLCKPKRRGLLVQRKRLVTTASDLSGLGVLLAAHDRFAFAAHDGGGDFDVNDVAAFRGIEHQVQHQLFDQAP